MFSPPAPCSKAEKGLRTLTPDDHGVNITRERIALGKLSHSRPQAIKSHKASGPLRYSHLPRLLLLVSGLGFGIMSGVLQTANMLDIMSGPGMIPSRGCSDQNLFVISCA